MTASKVIKTLTQIAVVEIRLKYPSSGLGQVELIAGTHWLLGGIRWRSLELQLSARKTTVPPAGEKGPDTL